MTPPTVLVSKPVKSAMPWSSCTTGEPARRSVKEAIGPGPLGRSTRRRRSSRCSGRTASFRLGAMKPSRRLAWANVSDASSGAGLPSRKAGCMRAMLSCARSASPAARPRHEGAIAGAHQLLELGLGVAQRARRRVRRLGAELVRLVLRDARQPQLGALVQRACRGPPASRRGGERPRRGSSWSRPPSSRAGRARAPPRRRSPRCASSGTRSSSSQKRSTGRTSATSGRSSSSVAAAISASSRCSGASSAAGAISTRSASSSERWVKVENQVSRSTSTSNSSQRTARSSVAGYTSRMSPRIANWPRSSTCSTRS